MLADSDITAKDDKAEERAVSCFDEGAEIVDEAVLRLTNDLVLIYISLLHEEVCVSTALFPF